MRRRGLFGAGLALATGRGIALAQTAARKVRIAYLGGSSPDPATQRYQIEPLREGLRALGWIEGQNLTIDFRWAEGRYESLPGLLQALIRLEPDLLVAAGPRPALIARDAVKTLPVVAVAVDDPVEMGLAQSVARPGGNINGISAAFDGLLEERLQLLKDITPAARRFAILFNPNTVPPKALAEAVPGWERTHGVTLQLELTRDPEDFDAAFAAMAREQANGVAIVADAMIWVNRARLGELCLTQRLLSIWGGGSHLDAGGTLSYQGDWPALFRRAASLVDKILKGGKPAELAVEQPTRFTLAINLKTAKALGIAIPQSLLLRADEVIE